MCKVYTGIAQISLLRIMRPRFLAVRKKLQTTGRKEARINPVVSDWNQRYQSELMVLYVYKDKYKITHGYMQVLGYISVSPSSVF